MSRKLKEVSHNPSDNHKADIVQNRIPESLFDENPGTKNGPAPDPFDMESLRLTQDFESAAGVKQRLTNIPCRKPLQCEFFRVRPGEDWRLETATYEDKIGRESYLVSRDLWPEYAADMKPVCLRLVVNTQKDIFLWPLKMPGQDGRSNSWNDSAIEASRIAETAWIRITANMRNGLYNVFEATGKIPNPVWPELTFQEILNLAFKNRRIEDDSHPILRSLRGEA